VLNVLGGSQYRDAAPVLRIQVLALIPVFVAHACQLVLIAVRRQSALAAASGAALLIVIVLGLILVPAYGARGAAVAAVAAEVAFALGICLLLVHSDRVLLPNFAFIWKPGLAAASGAVVGAIGDLSAWVSAINASVMFGAVLVATRAIPPEVWDGLVRRRR
jgi:O-antigen/teichoic acid export membrane protein